MSAKKVAKKKTARKRAPSRAAPDPQPLEDDLAVGDEGQDPINPEPEPEPVKKAKTDAPPKGDPSMGDKDPAVIAWWRKHDPKEAARRYDGRKGTNLEPQQPEA